MRVYYSEFVSHCIRFYIRYPSPRFRSEADKKNWNACFNAFNTFSDSERATFLDIYRDGGDRLNENINRVAKSNGVKSGSLWKLVENFERRIAKKRGLI